MYEYEFFTWLRNYLLKWTTTNTYFSDEVHIRKELIKVFGNKDYIVWNKISKAEVEIVPRSSHRSRLGQTVTVRKKGGVVNDGWRGAKANLQKVPGGNWRKEIWRNSIQGENGQELWRIEDIGPHTESSHPIRNSRNRSVHTVGGLEIVHGQWSPQSSWKGRLPTTHRSVKGVTRDKESST